MFSNLVSVLIQDVNRSYDVADIKRYNRRYLVTQRLLQFAYIMHSRVFLCVLSVAFLASFAQGNWYVFFIIYLYTTISAILIVISQGQNGEIAQEITGFIKLGLHKLLSFHL